MISILMVFGDLTSSVCKTRASFMNCKLRAGPYLMGFLVRYVEL